MTEGHELSSLSNLVANTIRLERRWKSPGEKSKRFEA